MGTRSEGKCYSGYGSAQQGCRPLPARLHPRLWEALASWAGSGCCRVRWLPALERSVRGTHVCHWGLPVAGGQSKGRPLVGGNKARDDGPPAALVLSLRAVSFDPLEKGETFPASVCGGRTQNLKKKHSRGLFPTEGRVLKVWKTPCVKKSTFKGGRGRSSPQPDAGRCAPRRLREVSPRRRPRAPPLREARAPAPQLPGLSPL